jgi:maltose O-acetyltransferase
MGDDVHVDQGASIGVTDCVTIGDGCRIGPHVQIMDNNFHRLELERRDEFPESRRVTIGNHVRIGAMALILPGATIGDGSVIAARSVVSGSIPAGSIAIGLPATVVDTK